MLELKLSGHTDTLTEANILIIELYKRGEIENRKQYRNALDKFHTHYLELPSKTLEQIALNTRPKIEEHMLMAMNKSIHREHSSQPLQIKKKQFKMAVTFLPSYKGIINSTIKKITNSIVRYQVMMMISV